MVAFVIYCVILGQLFGLWVDILTEKEADFLLYYTIMPIVVSHISSHYSLKVIELNDITIRSLLEIVPAQNSLTF